MPTNPPTWEDTVEVTPPKWEDTQDIAPPAEPPGYVPESPAAPLRFDPAYMGVPMGEWEKPMLEVPASIPKALIKGSMALPTPNVTQLLRLLPPAKREEAIQGIAESAASGASSLTSPGGIGVAAGLAAAPQVVLPAMMIQGASQVPAGVQAVRQAEGVGQTAKAAADLAQTLAMVAGPVVPPVARRLQALRRPPVIPMERPPVIPPEQPPIIPPEVKPIEPVTEPAVPVVVEMSEKSKAALASASPEYRRALRAEGLTDADMGDLLSGEASVSDVVARRLKPFEGGGGPDHAKALQEARDDAIARIEALGAKFKTPAAPAAEPTKAQFGDPLNPSNKFTAQPAKLEPDGGIFYAREHRMGELENRPGQSGFLVVDRDAVDEMAFEHDTYQFTPEDVKKTGMKFVSIPELDAAKGDFYDAIQNQKKGAPDATKERQVQESVLGERERTEAQRIPAETGVSDSVQPATSVAEAPPETLSNADAREPVLGEPPSKTAAVESPLAKLDRIEDATDFIKEVKQSKKPPTSADEALERYKRNTSIGRSRGEKFVSDEEFKSLWDTFNPPSKTAVGKGVQKAQAKVAQVVSTEGKRSAKEIKDDLIAEIQDRLSKAPSEAKPGETVTIEIPDDGVFTISNTVEALSEILARAKKIKTDIKPPGVSKKAIKSSAEAIRLSSGENQRIREAQEQLAKEQKEREEARRNIRSEKMVDDYTEKHFVNWLESVVPEDYRDDVEIAMRRYVKANPEVLQHAGWPEIRERAESEPPPPAAETGEKGPGEGPGALTAGTSPTGKSQIEQLADAFRNKAPAKERAWQLVRQSFDFGQRAAAAKDAFSRVLSGINTARKAAQAALTSFEKPDDLLKAKGELSASVETRGWQAREFSKAVKQDTPDIRKRIAMSKWIEADGDPAKLAVGEAATKPEFKQGYRDAQNLTPDEQIKAQNISNYFEARLQEAIDAGVLETGVEDYIHRIYPKDTAFRQRALAYVQSGILSKNPSLAKKRLFEWDWQAEAAGLRPVQDMLPRIIDYETSLSKAIAARQFIAKLTQMKGPDGRPVIGIKGVGVPVTDPSGVRTATVIKPLGDFKKANNPADPLNYRGDYVNKEYGSLSRWKWVGTDTDGKPIFLQGDVAIHPAFVGRVQALLEPSHVRYGRYPRLGTGLLTVGSTVKQTMLDLSGFHQVQIAVHGLEHRVNPFHLVQDIDFADPKMQGLLKGGLTLGGEFHESHMGEGLVGRSLTQHVPVLGPLLETYHNWLFQDFIPRVKTTMALHALERNRARYANDLTSGKMTEADLNYLTAKQANAAFGELNYITMERSKTTQDLARLIMLAPDFLEARAKFVGQALTKYGTEQRMALLFGALAMYSAARVLNKIIDDQYHLEPENLFNVVKGNTRYSLRTVQGDVLHAITRPLSFWLNRLNPVYSRTLLELISQRDQFGRKRDLRQILGDTVSTVRPIALRSSREQSLLQSIWNAFGVTARRYDDVQEARKLADDWKKKNKVRETPGEFIYDSDKDPLRPLKLALSDNDDGGAVAEIRKVLQGKVMTLPKMDDYFRRYAKANFTGSAFNERKWMQSLSADDRKTVQAAQQHRQAMLRLYYQARQQYFTALNAPK